MKSVDDIKNLLSEIIGESKRVAVLGCGSPLRGDDGAGTLAAERLLNLSGNARAFCGGTAPENFTGEIKRFRPETLLVVDAADTGSPPGEIAMIQIDNIDGASFSTHMLPLNIMLDYLRDETGCRVHILGIQGASLEFGAEMTKEVKTAVDTIVTALTEILTE